MSADFEGFDGQTAPQPSKNQFWTRSGVNAMAAPGNGSLPPGQAETPAFTKRTKAVTTAEFIKNTAA